jgi:hypothetical protein
MQSCTTGLLGCQSRIISEFGYSNNLWSLLRHSFQHPYGPGTTERASQ